MGTRGLTAVVKNGAYRVAQYGQWDHYPSGQGITALKFLNTPGNVDKLGKVAERTRFLDDEEYQAATKEITGGASMINTDQANKIAEIFPFITRDLGANILNALVDAPEDADLALFDQHEFAGEGLFCEYAYVIDLDNLRFEAYVGFQNEDHSDGRFAGMTSSADFTPKYAGEHYFAPVRLLASWPLDSLPTEEAFLKTLGGIEHYFASQKDGYDAADYEDEDGNTPEPIPGPIVFAGSLITT